MTKRDYSSDVLRSALAAASHNPQARERILADEVLHLREELAAAEQRAQTAETMLAKIQAAEIMRINGGLRELTEVLSKAVEPK